MLQATREGFGSSPRSSTSTLTWQAGPVMALAATRKLARRVPFCHTNRAWALSLTSTRSVLEFGGLSRS